MGLAASQARFLGLTARKADCEYRSMQLAQDKLSITRQLAEVTDDYQNSLNATKLCWDYNGESDNVQNLSYSLLMTPSEFNNYTPYLLTNKTGKIMLAGNFAKAAEAAGIAKDGSTSRTSSGYSKFVEALCSNKVINSDFKDKILASSKYTYYSYANPSSGDVILTRSTTPDGGTESAGTILGSLTGNNALKLSQIKEYADGVLPSRITALTTAQQTILKEALGVTTLTKDATSNRYYYEVGGSKVYLTGDDYTKYLTGTNSLNLDIKTDYLDGTLINLTELQLQKLTNVFGNNISKIGTPYSESAGFGGEQLNKDYVSGNNKVALINKLRDENDKAVNLFQYYNSTKNVSSDLGTVLKDITSSNLYKNGVQGSDYDFSTLDIGDLFTNDITVTGVSDTMISNFIDTLAKSGSGVLYNKLVGSNADATTKKAWANALAVVKYRFAGNSTTSISKDDAGSNARNYNTLCSYGSGDNDNAVSLSNILSCLLTQYEINLNGSENGYYIMDQTSGSSFVTDDNDYLYALNNVEAVDDTDTLKADFYMQLYNNLCVNGWQTEEKLTDKDYLESTLRNGTYFLSSLHSDNYFYQSRYSEEDCIIEVKDEDAIAQAEAEFEAQKSKLEYKEETIDLEMKNLDAEISETTTEVDSVKNLISKNIEKIFAQFQ